MGIGKFIDCPHCRAQNSSSLSKLDMNDVDGDTGLSKMDVVLSFSLEV